VNTIARVLTVLLALAAPACGASALTLPPAGDCDAMLTAGGTVWMGQFSGNYEDLFDHRHMIFARGCFTMEYECRRWINEVQTAVVFPGVMSCRAVRPH
jgi:hypothetical protein